MLETKRARGFLLVAIVALVAGLAIGSLALSRMAIDGAVDDTEAELEAGLGATDAEQLTTLFFAMNAGDLDAGEEIDELVVVEDLSPFVMMPEGDDFVARYLVSTWGDEAVVEARWSGEDLEVREIKS